MHTKYRFLVAAFSLGLIATFSQTILIRELLVAFTGNELTISLILALWLISVSSGSLIARRIKESTSLPRLVSLLVIIAGISLLLQVISIRTIRPLIAPIGELVSPGMILILTATGIVPAAIVLGAIFVGLVTLIRRSFRSPISLTYGLESLGSTVSGILLSLWLLARLNPMELGFTCVVISFLTATLLMARNPMRLYVSVILVISIGSILGVLIGRSIDLGLRQKQWQPLQVIESLDSKYGNIVVTRRGDMYDFYETGSLSFTVPDAYFAEESIHVPALLHPNPRRVLLIGGTGSGLISELAKYPSVSAIDFVELDPRTIELVERYAPRGWLKKAGIEVKAIYGDARAFVMRAKGQYDLIIVSVGLPLSLQLNRYYTLEFFRFLKPILSEDGVVAVKLPSQGAYLGPELASFVSSVLSAFQRVFPYVELIPGGYIHIIASDQPLAHVGTNLIDVFDRSGVEASYVNAYTLWERLNPLRISQLDSVVVMHEMPPNTDSRPACFSFAMSLWARRFTSGKMLGKLIAGYNLVRHYVILFALAGVVFLIYASFVRTGPSGLIPIVALYSMGLTTMIVQILLVFSFQIVNGYVYNQIAGLTAGFMAGMGLVSSYLANGPATSHTWRRLFVAQTALVSVPLMVWGLFALTTKAAFLDQTLTATMFIALAVINGAVGGAIFAIASSLLSTLNPRVGETAALCYSADLVGASIAGFLTGFVFVPTLGIVSCTQSIALINIVMLIFSLSLLVIPSRKPLLH